jgi:hypothetical protein
MLPFFLLSLRQPGLIPVLLFLVQPVPEVRQGGLVGTKGHDRVVLLEGHPEPPSQRSDDEILGQNIGGGVRRRRDVRMMVPATSWVAVVFPRLRLRTPVP